jgi:hypothetical protein
VWNGNCWELTEFPLYINGKEEVQALERARDEVGSKDNDN